MLAEVHDPEFAREATAARRGLQGIYLPDPATTNDGIKPSIFTPNKPK